MANIFTYEVQDIDLKECMKVKINCQQSDTIVLQFNIFDYDIPVDLTNFNVSFIAKKPSGIIYGQVENITKSNNFLSISCDSQLVSETGRVVSNLVITDNNGNRKGSYFVVFNVFGIITDEDRVVSKNFVDILNRFDEDVAIALSLSVTFKSDIEKAQIISDDFAEKIPLAQSTNSTLNNTINNAKTINNTLTNTNSTANTLDDKLNSDIVIGKTVKNNLETNMISGNILNDTLTTTIANADDKLQEFQNYDTTELVPLSNTMLNEMYCNKELLSINHGLNGYPVAKMTYTEFGGGVGGAGDFPASANSDCNLMQNKVIYTDSNNMTIFVPQNYYIASPTIAKINNHKYIVTFTNSTRSLLIELIEGSISEDIANITTINKTISDLNYQTAQGTSNAIMLTINGILTNGYPLTFISSANNNGNPTTVNGKYLYKPNTTTSPILKEGKAYTIWYNSTSDCFFIKASAEGNAIQSDVLATKRFSTDEDTDLEGGMPNNGTLTYTPSVSTQTIPLGYTSGGTVIGDADLISANIKAGISIFGVNGKSSVVDTSDATVVASKMLSGESGYVNGNKVIGNIPSKTAQTYTSSTVNQTIASGQYLSESQTILGDSNLISSNIVSGKSIFGLVGSAMVVSTASGSSSNTGGTSSETYAMDIPFSPRLIVVTGSTGYSFSTTNLSFLILYANNYSSSYISKSGSQYIISYSKLTSQSGGLGSSISWTAYTW